MEFIITGDGRIPIQPQALDAPVKGKHEAAFAVAEGTVKELRMAFLPAFWLLTLDGMRRRIVDGQR